MNEEEKINKIHEKIGDLYAKDDYSELKKISPTFTENVLNRLMRGKIYEWNEYENNVNRKITEILVSIIQVLQEQEQIQKQEQEQKQEQNQTNTYFADTLAHQDFTIQQLINKCNELEIKLDKLDLKLNYLISADNNVDSKVVQVLQVMKYGDAVGNYALAISQNMRCHGVSCDIYTYEIDAHIKEDNIKLISQMPVLNEQDVLIIHVAGEIDILNVVEAFACKVIVCYHNITPPVFFEHYNQFAYDSTLRGIEQLKSVSNKIKYCIADSEFNKQDLIKLGFEAKIKVFPLMLRFEEYDMVSDKILKEKDMNVNTILSVGRIVPNKKIEDVITAFHYYKTMYNKKARLILAGKYEKEDLYYKKLIQIIEKNNISDVYFTGHISAEELNGYFMISDIYLCMSEHEGFCVPLVEAMYFGLPIVAYNCTAVPETLGGAGILLNNKNPDVIAKEINHIFSDSKYRNDIIKKQKERLVYFSKSDIKEQLYSYIVQIMEEK